jgi:hypothetical protein
MEICKAMVCGRTVSIKNMLEAGKIIKLTDMEFMQHKKVIIKVKIN